MTLRSKTIHIPFCILLLLCASPILAQEKENEEHKPKIRGAIMMANSHIPKAYKRGKKVTTIPTWGFDVDYFFHPRWSVALQGDIKLQSFEIEKGNGVVLERSYPVAVATVIHYHVLRHWSFYAGPVMNSIHMKIYSW